MKTIGIVAAAIIALLYFSTPQDQRLDAAKPQLDTQIEQVVSVTELQDLTKAIGSLEQNVEDRLSVVESRFTSLETSQVADAACPDAELLESRVAALESDVASLKSSLAKYQTPVSATTVVGSPYSAKWKNNDGKTLRDHAVDVHGFDPNQSDSDIARLHDAWHDANGGHPPKRQVTRSFNVSSGNCPGGVCPTGYSRTTTRTVNSGSGYTFGQPLRNLGKVFRR